MLSGHPQASFRNEVVVHVGEDIGFVVVRTYVQCLNAASLLEGFEAHVAEAGRAILCGHGRHSVNLHGTSIGRADMSGRRADALQ